MRSSPGQCASVRKGVRVLRLRGNAATVAQVRSVGSHGHSTLCVPERCEWRSALILSRVVARFVPMTSGKSHHVLAPTHQWQV